MNWSISQSLINKYLWQRCANSIKFARVFLQKSLPNTFYKVSQYRCGKRHALAFMKDVYSYKWAATRENQQCGFWSGLTQTRRYSFWRWLEAWNFVFRKSRYCTIQLAKTKTLISFADTAKLICIFVFAYADCWFSHDAAQMCLLGYVRWVIIILVSTTAKKNIKKIFGIVSLALFVAMCER